MYGGEGWEVGHLGGSGWESRWIGGEDGWAAHVMRRE